MSKGSIAQVSRSLFVRQSLLVQYAAKEIQSLK